MDVTVASRTGRSRPASEDRWVAVTGASGLLLAVADGMGGTIAGAAAADAALAALVEALAATGPVATAPVAAPAAIPTAVPTAVPAAVPSAVPAAVPSAVPAAVPSAVPAAVPSAVPAAVPTEVPTTVRSAVPSDRLTAGRTAVLPGAPADQRTVETGDRAQDTGWLAESSAAGPEGRTTPMAIMVPERGPDLAAAVAAAHVRVRRLATDGMPVPLRPGTTLTAALVTGRRLRLAHLGDSSCWLLRRGRLRRLTEEHTHAAQLVAAGAVEPGSPAQRRLDGMLTRFAGMPGSACPQLVTVRLRAGDRILVATDGVTRALTVPVLATLLGRPGITATELVDAASDAGGRDDATALLAAVPGGVPGDMDTTRPDLNTRYVAEGAR